MGLSWGWLDTQCLMELLKYRDWNHDSEIIKIHQKIILIIVMIITTKYLLLGAFYVSSYLTSQEPHKIFTILIPLFRCRNPRLRWYRNLLSITQPVKCRSGTWTQVCFTPESTPLWFSYQESSPGSQEALTGSACSPWVPPSWDPRATITMFQTLVTKKKTENYCLTILEARVHNQALGQFCVWWQRDRELCCGDLLTLAFVSMTCSEGPGGTGSSGSSQPVFCGSCWGVHPTPHGTCYSRLHFTRTRTWFQNCFKFIILGCLSEIQGKHEGFHLKYGFCSSSLFLMRKHLHLLS